MPYGPSGAPQPLVRMRGAPWRFWPITARPPPAECGCGCLSHQRSRVLDAWVHVARLAKAAAAPVPGLHHDVAFLESRLPVSEGPVDVAAALSRRLMSLIASVAHSTLGARQPPAKLKQFSSPTLIGIGTALWHYAQHRVRQVLLPPPPTPVQYPLRIHTTVTVNNAASCAPAVAPVAPAQPGRHGLVVGLPVMAPPSHVVDSDEASTPLHTVLMETRYFLSALHSRVVPLVMAPPPAALQASTPATACVCSAVYLADSVSLSLMDPAIAYAVVASTLQHLRRVLGPSALQPSAVHVARRVIGQSAANVLSSVTAATPVPAPLSKALQLVRVAEVGCFKHDGS